MFLSGCKVRLLLNHLTVAPPGLWSQSRHLGLKKYTNVSSRLGSDSCLIRDYAHVINFRIIIDYWLVKPTTRSHCGLRRLTSWPRPSTSCVSEECLCRVRRCKPIINTSTGNEREKQLYRSNQ